MIILFLSPLWSRPLHKFQKNGVKMMSQLVGYFCLHISRLAFWIHMGWEWFRWSLLCRCCFCFDCYSDERYDHRGLPLGFFGFPDMEGFFEGSAPGAGCDTHRGMPKVHQQVADPVRARRGKKQHVWCTVYIPDDDNVLYIHVCIYIDMYIHTDIHTYTYRCIMYVCIFVLRVWSGTFCKGLSTMVEGQTHDAHKSTPQCICYCTWWCHWSI